MILSKMKEQMEKIMFWKVSFEERINETFKTKFRKLETDIE